ncbi:MAG: S9 family peptidase [Magnetovibrionaceae bacterium]
MKAPIAAVRPETLNLHGHSTEDDYAWLKDPNWQAVMREPETLDGEIRSYLEAENAFTEAALAPLAELRADLVAEMRGRIREDDSSVPAPDGDFSYAVRYREGGQHPIFYRRDRLASEHSETLLVDGDALAEGEAFLKIGDCEHAPDHAHVAYSLDTKGSEYFTIVVKDMATGALLDDVIEHVQGDVTWGEDGRTLYYTVLDDNHRPCKVMRHRLGAPVEQDEVVYEEQDPGFFVGVSKTESGRFVLIHAHNHTTSEVYALDAADPAAKAKLLHGRVRDLEVDYTDQGDHWIIRTNADGAEDFKLSRAPLDAPEQAGWSDLEPHRRGRLIRSVLVFEDWLVWLERIEGLPKIQVRNVETGEGHALDFDEPVYELGMVAGYEYKTDILRFTYTSLTTPQTVFDYDMRRRTRVVRKVQEVPSGHDPADYIADRLMAPAPDGELVPVSVIRHKDTPRDGSAALLLYGYGSYGMAMPAGFATNRFSLIDRGMVYAIAHIRGGMEKGYHWYQNGKGPKKANTFSDFLAAADHLIAEGYTAKGRIVGHGGSAGGMLMGAVANRGPDRFGAILAEVPFVDVLNTMADDQLPLTPPEWPEWGNPIEDEAAYRTILDYSPYDNVTEQAYPAIIATGGLTDPRVTYWEPAKWIAKLRAKDTGDKPLLLRINMEAGHGGASGRFDRLDEIALIYAFGLSAVGLAEPLKMVEGS